MYIAFGLLGILGQIVSLIALVISAIIKKPTKKWVVLFASFFLVFLSAGILTITSSDNEQLESTYQTEANLIEDADVSTTNEVNTETESQQVSNTLEEPSGNESSDISSKMVSLGFTEDEADRIRDIFTTVGITEMGSVKPGAGDGIDNLQSFIAPVFNSYQLQVNFTIENRTLCYIELAGIPASKYETYVSMFGKPKVREVDTVIAITLYDIWDENGEIAEGAVGYKAVYNNDKQTLTAYNP